MERPRKLFAAAAATLALAGCADAAPAQQPATPSVALLDCETPPRDTSTLVDSHMNPHGKGVIIDLYKCTINPGTTEESLTKLIELNQIETNGRRTLINRAVATPPNSENDEFFGHIDLRSIDACLIVNF